MSKSFYRSVNTALVIVVPTLNSAQRTRRFEDYQGAPYGSAAQYIMDSALSSDEAEQING